MRVFRVPAKVANPGSVQPVAMSRTSSNRPSVSHVRRIPCMRPSLLFVLMLSACGGKDADPSQPVAEAPKAAGAGKVIEITGNVTASRGTEVRKLAAADPVVAEDVIDTGTDGSIVIELAHNNARWSLEAGIKSRVDESVAWGLPKQDHASVVDHATSAAGRHADRQAAETAASAAEAPAVEAKVEAKVEANARPAAAATAAPKPAVKPVKPAEVTRNNLARDKSIDALLDLPDSLDRQAIVNGMRAAKDRIAACNKTEAHGMLKLTVKVAADGTVASVDVKQSVETALDTCVVGVLKGLTFNRSKTGGTFSYPFSF